MLNDITLTVTFFSDAKGTGDTYTTSQDNPDLSTLGLANTFSSVTLPPQTKVVMYSGANYTGKTLTVGNGSLEILNIDFSNTIGWIDHNTQTDFGWDGINMNDQCCSFKLYGEIQETCLSSFFEFDLNYTGQGNEPCYIFDYLYGAQYLTYYNEDDSSFGPEHDDKASSALVFSDRYAHFYEDKAWGGRVTGFNGSGVSGRTRIYNFDGNISWLNNIASSIKVGNLS
jgi:hypothetical protein